MSILKILDLISLPLKEKREVIKYFKESLPEIVITDTYQEMIDLVEDDDTNGVKLFFIKSDEENGIGGDPGIYFYQRLNGVDKIFRIAFVEQER
jgi:hypothetical protein